MLAKERNEATPEAIASACSLAETFHRTLIVVHARRPEEAIAFLNPAATTAEQFGVESSGRFPVRLIVKDGKPSDAMVEAIGQYSPSVLVIGVKHTSDTPGPHGTAFTLLARSRVPVLCVPHPVASASQESETCTSVPC